MTLRLHDTATRTVRDFVPQTPGQVGIYLCGLTVQSVPHIGHLRSAVNFDVLRRWLVHTGLEVTYIRNVTDVDDKILDKANAQGRPFWAIAYANKLVLDASYAALNVLPATYEPQATGHIPDMHELIAELIERGHAYPAASGNASGVRCNPCRVRSNAHARIAAGTEIQLDLLSRTFQRRIIGSCGFHSPPGPDGRVDGDR